MKSLIRVLVVDDSAFMRKVISDIINKDPRLEVIGTARNGQDAVEKHKVLQPDVITLDVEMPVMNGLEALQLIMKHKPIPVVMISSLTKAGAGTTLLAMEYGAVDFVAKPSGAISLDIGKLEKDIQQIVIEAAGANLQVTKSPKELAPLISLSPSKKKKIIAIGTSTGGPKALKQVISQLPASIAAPILIVQHMPAGFTKSLSERLDSLSPIQVKEAESEDLLVNGIAYLAPGGYHLEIEGGSNLRTKTTLNEPRKGHRPSVDVLFESLAIRNDIDVLAVIMTGMGTDGTEGLIQLKSKGSCYAIAEAEESCVVFGMPKSVIKSNLVNEVVHVDHIAQRIVQYCKG